MIKDQLSNAMSAICRVGHSVPDLWQLVAPLRICKLMGFLLRITPPLLYLHLRIPLLQNSARLIPPADAYAWQPIPFRHLSSNYPTITQQIQAAHGDSESHGLIAATALQSLGF
jgi:hypothetical protein